MRTVITDCITTTRLMLTVILITDCKKKQQLVFVIEYKVRLRLRP
jgi:hypothetical protein